MKVVKVGQRVVVIDGKVKGEKATVTPNPEHGQHQDGDFVWITFDRDKAHVGSWEILNAGWWPISRLKAI